MKKVIEASMAVAIATKLCNPAVIPMYPITPQTHIVERIADFINDGELDSEMIHVESEHSALSAAVGASATGVRTFTATASQGLALMHEILFVASGMRLPIVMAIANRTLSAPINIWNDHQDSMSARDSGWMQFYVESAQEAFDTIIQAYKIAENRDILTPAMVCLDGYTLSHVYEPVDLLTQQEVDSFLPKYKPLYQLDTEKPVTMGPVGFPDTFMELKEGQQNALLSSLKAIKTVHAEFKSEFNRSYGNGLIEKYKMKGAQYAVICMGTICGTARTVIDRLRKEGKKVGMIKLRTFRPFPIQEIVSATKGLKGIGVLDRSISLGYKGPLYTEIRNTLCNSETIINGFIVGLGGRDVTPSHIERSLDDLKTNKKTQWLK